MSLTDKKDNTLGRGSAAGRGEGGQGPFCAVPVGRPRLHEAGPWPPWLGQGPSQAPLTQDCLAGPVTGPLRLTSCGQPERGLRRAGRGYHGSGQLPGQRGGWHARLGFGLCFCLKSHRPHPQMPQASCFWVSGFPLRSGAGPWFSPRSLWGRVGGERGQPPSCLGPSSLPV